jgi:peptidylprolyl isomerase
MDRIGRMKERKRLVSLILLILSIPVTSSYLHTDPLLPIKRAGVRAAGYAMLRETDELRAKEIMPEEVREGDTVRVRYRGTLADGAVFDESPAGEPFEFTVGAGQTIAGFDAGVRGMKVGETRTVEIEADEAYGQRVEALVNTVAREGMRLGQEPEVGMNVVMQLPDGNQIPLTITEVTETHVTLDANHPLAGEKLIFEIELLEIN